MPETLILRFIDPADTRVDAFQIDAQGRRFGQPERCELKDCARLAHNRRVVALLPGERVSLLDADIPTRKRQKILQAAPWVLEDRLAQDVESLHFALGPRTENDRVRIAVVDRSDLEALVGALEDAGIVADVVIPDFLALPREPDEWTMLVEDDRVIVRTDECDGLSTDRSLSMEMLDALIDHSRDAHALPQRIRILRSRDDDELVRALGQSAEAMPEIVDEANDGTPVNAWVPSVPARPPLNLASGEFQMHQEKDEWWLPWRPVLALASAWLMVLAVGEAVNLHQLSQENQRLEQRVEAVFREALPDATRMVNPRLRMERRLNALRGGGGESDFLPTMTVLGSSLANLDQGRLQGISYRPGTLDLSIQVDNAGTLDRIKENIQSNAGFSARIQSANSGDDGVDGRLQIRRQEN
jgi:general secretion pathway protein L